MSQPEPPGLARRTRGPLQRLAPPVLVVVAVALIALVLVLLGVPARLVLTPIFAAAAAAVAGGAVFITATSVLGAAQEPGSDEATGNPPEVEEVVARAEAAVRAWEEVRSAQTGQQPSPDDIAAKRNVASEAWRIASDMGVRAALQRPGAERQWNRLSQRLRALRDATGNLGASPADQAMLSSMEDEAHEAVLAFGRAMRDRGDASRPDANPDLSSADASDGA